MATRSTSNASDWRTRPLDDELGEALRAELLRWPGVQPRAMMGTLSFFRGKQMLGCYINRALFKRKSPKWANRAGEPPVVWIRLSPEDKEKALRRPHVRESLTNKMKTWIEVPMASRGALEEAVHWFGHAYEHPPRLAKPRKRRRNH